MRFQSGLAFGLSISAAFAAPLEQGKLDLPTIQSTFDAIQGGIDKMVSGIKSFNGDRNTLGGFIQDSSAILASLQEGTEKVAKSPAMGLTDAIGILGPVQILSSKVDEIIFALAEKKESLKNAGAGSVVLQELQKQKAGADALVESITNNLPLPSLLGVVAGPIAKQITDKLETGIKQWS